MKKHLMVAAMLLAGTAAQAQDVYGTWQTETSDEGAFLHVKIGPCGNNASKVCGTITKVVNSENQEIKGKPIIWGMTERGANSWSKGTIWAPDDDETYNSSMELKGNVLAVKGCVLVFCRGQNWKRIN